MKSYKRLKAVQKAYELVVEVYRVTEGFPKAEQFGLISQLRRASVSVLAKDLGFLSEEDYHRLEDLRSNVGSLTYGLIKSLRAA